MVGIGYEGHETAPDNAGQKIFSYFHDAGPIDLNIFNDRIIKVDQELNPAGIGAARAKTESRRGKIPGKNHILEQLILGGIIQNSLLGMNFDSGKSPLLGNVHCQSEIVISRMTKCKGRFSRMKAAADGVNTVVKSRLVMGYLSKDPRNPHFIGEVFFDCVGHFRKTMPQHFDVLSHFAGLISNDLIK